MYSDGVLEALLADRSSLLSDGSLSVLTRFEPDGSVDIIRSRLSMLTFANNANFHDIAVQIGSGDRIPNHPLLPRQRLRESLSSRRHLKVSRWVISRKCSKDTIVLLGELGSGLECEMSISLSSFEFWVSFPAPVPGQTCAHSNGDGVQILHKYIQCEQRGSVFNPPRLCFLQPLLEGVSFGLEITNSVDDPFVYTNLSRARDVLSVYSAECSGTDPRSLRLPTCYSYPHQSTCEDFTRCISPSLQSPSRTALVNIEYWPEQDATLYVPSMTNGIPHIVVGGTCVLVGTCPDGEHWRCIRRTSDGSGSLIEAIAASFPPTDSASRIIVALIRRMRQLIELNNRVIGMHTFTPSDPDPASFCMPGASAYVDKVGLFELSPGGHVSAQFVDRTRVWCQLKLPGCVIDRFNSTVTILDAEANKRELTWNLLLDRTSPCWAQYGAYVGAVLGFLETVTGGNPHAMRKQVAAVSDVECERIARLLVMHRGT